MNLRHVVVIPEGIVQLQALMSVQFSTSERSFFVRTAVVPSVVISVSLFTVCVGVGAA